MSGSQISSVQQQVSAYQKAHPGAVSSQSSSSSTGKTVSGDMTLVNLFRAVDPKYAGEGGMPYGTTDTPMANFGPAYISPHNQALDFTDAPRSLEHLMPLLGAGGATDTPRYLYHMM